MTDNSTFDYPSPSQLEQLAGAAHAHQAATPTNDVINQRPPNPRKRRADGSSAAGSRGVANLTPEQLAKKRANDREAQRAIRERTKNTIEGLEARVRELEGLDGYQEIQRIAKERDAALQEVEALKARLAEFTNLANQHQAALQPHGLEDLAMATSQQAPLPIPQTQRTGRDSMTLSPAQDYLHPDLRSQQAEGAPTANMRSLPNGSPASPKTTRRGKGDSPEWQRLPAHSPPSNPLDAAVFALVSSGRSRIEQGQSLPVAIGPDSPSFSGLKSELPGVSSNPLVAGVSELVNTHFGPNDIDLPKRVASMYTVYLVVRWMISPTEATFEKLPQWLRPTPLQIQKPHPVWVDMLPWPSLRDKAIMSPEEYALNAFFYHNYVPNLSVNFPYHADLCLTRSESTQKGVRGKAAQKNDDLMINPIFEAHIRDISHWTISSLGPLQHDGDLEGLLRGLGSSKTEDD